MSLYSSLCTNVILPLGDFLTGQDVLSHLRFFRETQYFSPEDISRLRDSLLRETIKTAYLEVPFYRDLYDAHRVDVNSIRGQEDLWQLPTVSKDMLRDAGPLCLRDSGRKRYVYSTSGSTGRPFSLHVDSETVSRARALMMLRTLYCGYQPGERVLQTGTAIERGIVKGVKDRLLRVNYVSAFDLSPELIDRQLEYIDRHKVKYLTGYAQSLDLFAHRAIEVGFNHSLAAAVSWGALLLPEYRTSIREAFGCKTYDSYGVGEGMQIAAQCGHTEDKYHMFSLAVVCEVGRDGTPLSPGELGELYLTRLDPGATPLIRYQIGDMGAISKQQQCGCGRNLPLMESIVGRTSDIVHTPSGKQLVIHFFSRIFSTEASVEQFQVVQRTPGAILIKLVVDREFNDSAKTRILKEIHTLGDPELMVDWDFVDSIPVGKNAKRRYVVSELNNNE